MYLCNCNCVFVFRYLCSCVFVKIHFPFPCLRFPLYRWWLGLFNLVLDDNTISPSIQYNCLLLYPATEANKWETVLFPSDYIDNRLDCQKIKMSSWSSSFFWRQNSADYGYQRIFASFGQNVVILKTNIFQSICTDSVENISISKTTRTVFQIGQSYKSFIFQHFSPK